MDTPQLGKDGKILEGLVTTLDEDGVVNISPMGPIVDAECNKFVFRPFQSSLTYRNLVRQREGIFHITDDVGLIASTAVGMPEPLPQLGAAKEIVGKALVGACRWHEFRIESIDDREERAILIGQTVRKVDNRNFFGFNRAQHAVLEAAILATRISLISKEDVASDMNRLAVIVKKTASSSEQSAFDFLREYINAAHSASTQEPCNE